MSLPLRFYTEPDQIRDRLIVLYAKANRVVAYNQSVAAGSPDVSLLDEQQTNTFQHWQPGLFFPRKYIKTLGATIDTLENRLANLERRAA